MATQEELTIALQKELGLAVLAKNDEDKLRIVSRIRNELSFTENLDKKTGLINDLEHLGIHYAGQDPPSKAVVDLTHKTLLKLKRDKNENNLRDVHRSWWRDPPLPCPKEDTITVSFEDVTAKRKKYEDKIEVWPTESVPASLDEPFDDLFLRFRTQANKKHRHPYRPCLNFDAVLSDSSLIRIDMSGSTPVRDVLNKLASYNHDHPARVPYIRNDDERVPMEQKSLPVWFFEPWDRTLPAWFSPAPPTWLDPSPPPAYNNLPQSQTSFIETYKKVPTLLIPGNGRNILPTCTTPSLISSHIYFIVHVIPSKSPDEEEFTSVVRPDTESDHVLPSNRFSPPLSLAQAKSFLGRAIQFSTQPIPAPEDDDKPKTKKRRKEIVKEKEARNIGYAWGLDPDTMQLHCFFMLNRQNHDFIIDLNVRASEATVTPRKWDGPPPSTMLVPKMFIEWVGLVTLAEDQRVMAEPSLPTASEEVKSDDQLYRSLVDRVKMLNASDQSRQFEVEESDALLFGDVSLAKGDGEDGFEAVVDGIKQGVWTVRIEEGGDYSRGVLHLSWVGSGPPLSAPTQASGPDTSSTDWELLSTFSVDSGRAGVFTRSAFADDGPLSLYGPDEEVTLECLLDFGMDEDARLPLESFCLVVPGGVICTVDDGGYEIFGKRDELGSVASIKINF